MHLPPPSSPNADHDRATLWATIYYCLRCGDACAALITLQNAPSNIAIPQPFHTVFTQLANYQTSHDAKSLFFTPSPSSSNNNTHQPPASLAAIISPQTRIALVELYHTVKTRSRSTTDHNTATNEDNDTETMFQLASLALLSLAEPLTSSSSNSPSSPAANVIQTIEDYIFASLWMAYHQTPSNFPSTTTSCEEHVAQLGQLLQHWGPSYFEGTDDSSNSVPSSGGWAYAFPLLLAQQYSTALTHLAEVGSGTGLLQATHLGLIMYHAGIPLYDFNLQPSQLEESKQNDKDASGKQLLSKLIVSYASAFQTADPKTALEYLVRLPDPTSTGTATASIGQFAKKQIRRLLLETRAFEPLAGKVSSNGSRESATDTSATPSSSLPAMDCYFSSTEVSSILADAAVDTLREGNKADAAELFALAGRYGSLLSLLNCELASHLVDVSPGEGGGSGEQLQQQQESEERRFWRNAALHFHSLHLAHGRTHVVEVLEKEGNLALGNTFQLLMNLMVFFDRCRDQHWEDAWTLIDSLLLLPQAEVEMTRKVEAFHCLDNVLQHSFHHIALASMECLYHQHSNLKSSLGRGQSASAAGATEQRLMELRGRGRLLVTFVGLIQMRSSTDTNARIARMEAYMM